MNAQIRNAILLSCAAALPTVAWAQTAAPAGGASGQLEEIVITAQKRPERLQDVPVSVAVVSGDSLSRANAGDITDLNNLVPSVNMNATINGRVPIGMRGISSNANEATVGLASGVAIMLDGVPIPSDSYLGNQLDDIATVEVLKGPQATLGGRTAAAGVINLITRNPSDHFEGSVGLTATNDKEYRGKLFLSGPVSDSVQFSVSAFGSKRDYPITNIATGDKTEQKSSGLRGKLNFKVNDDLDIKLAAYFGEQKSNGFNFVYTYVTPGASLLSGIAPNPFPPPVQSTLSQATLLAGITPAWGNLSYNSPVPDAGSDIKDTTGTLNIEYRMGGNTLTSTTAFQHETQTNIQDLFAFATFFSNDLRAAFQNFFTNILGLPGYPPGTPATWADFNNTQTQLIDVKQFSEELKLASPTDRDFSYLVGVFYSDTKVGLTETRTFVPAAVDYTVEPRTKTFDVYGRVTYKFTPATSLVAGLRYNADQLSYFEDERTYATAPGAPPFGPLTSQGSNNSSAVVGDLSLKQDLSKNAMVYATYSRGYAPRAYNTALALPDSTPQQPVGQEHIDNIELGTKGFYLDHRLSFNLAIFDTIYKNYQIQSYSNLPGYAAPPLILTNAAKAETRGIEADLAFAASGNTTVGISAAYIDAKFKDYTNAPCWGGAGAVPGTQQDPGPNCVTNGTQDVSGDPMPNSPKFKGTLSLDQRIPLGAGPVDLTLGGTYSYRSSAQMLPDQNPQGIQPAFGLLNLYAGVKDKAGKYSVVLFANNLTNHIYYGDVEDFWTGPWGSNAIVAQPARDAKRYFGLRFNADF